MTNNLLYRNRSIALAILLLFASTPARGAEPASPSFEIDLNELKKAKESAKKLAPPQKSPAPAVSRQHSNAGKRVSGSVATYTVKQGDNLFKILMRDFGMSNREAELLIPEVVRINGLARSTSLTTGKQLSIPLERRPAPQHRAKKQITAAAVRAEEPPAEQPVEPATGGSKTQPDKIDEHTLQSGQPPATPEPSASTVAEQTNAQAGAETPNDRLPGSSSPLTVKSVTGSTPDDIIDGLLNAMMLAWEPDKVINGKSGDNETFSVKVDRCLTFRGKRYVITVNTMDPFNYTMLRLVESAEYRVIQLNGQSDFAGLASTLLAQLGIRGTAGKFRFTPTVSESGSPRDIDGIMVEFDDRPTRIFLTNTPLDPVTSENLSSFAVEEL